MKILVLSHSAVVSGYHDRYREVTTQGRSELTLLVPRQWQQFNRLIRLEKTSDPHYRIIARQPICWGLKGHGARNVTHIYPGIGKLLKEIQPEIIELWEEPFAAVTAHTIWKARKIIPSVKIIFSSAQNLYRNYPPPFSWFEKYTYKHADFAFIMNSEVGKVMRRKGYRNDFLILPLGVNPDIFKKIDASSLRRELGLNKFTVGFIGKLDQQKGVLDLVRSCGKLKGEVNLLMIGEGPLQARISRLLKELGIEKDARIIPAVPYDRVPEYMNCMDVLVLPSVTLPGLKEQFGRVLIEAMSCEVPVIGSSSGEIPGIIGDAGLVFPEGKPDALAHQLRALMINRAHSRDLSRRGRERVLRRYDWDIIARQQIEVYSSLAGPSSGKGE